MIFVTVGTHEQQFNRLIKQIDLIAKNDLIDEKIIIQKGYTEYIPKYCEYNDFYSYNEMNKLMDNANIIITHGGPATFMNVLVKGKKPIVVPRRVEFNEHINNHQVDFLKKYLTKYQNVIPVFNIESLLDEIIKLRTEGNYSEKKNENKKFIEQFNTIVSKLVEK